MRRGTLLGMDMVTWGLDVSTDKGKTAAVAIAWTGREARVVEVVNPLAATDMAALIGQHRGQGWAVDVPFGWPDKFVELMGCRHENSLPRDLVPASARWEKWRTRDVAQRMTDRLLTDDPRIKTRPLPAAFQMLGATAAMWVLVEAELAGLGVVVDRAGVDGQVRRTRQRRWLPGA